MRTAAESEATGDWRNFKGDYYHLLHAIWLLLHEENAQVAFYQGNDLLAVVPEPQATKDDSIPILAGAQTSEKDIWVQLKSSPAAWTREGLIASVLFNFLYNALSSRLNGRQWEARLVSPGRIPQAGLRAFKANPTAHGDLDKAFTAKVTEAHGRWLADHPPAAHPGAQGVTLQIARELGLQVLEQLAEQEPISADAMEAQISTELALVCFDRALVTRVEDLLIGALAREASLGPRSARFFDVAWLDEVAGRSLRPRGKLDIDPVAACEEANARALPRSWDETYYVPRARLETAVAEFLRASESLFCLIGPSGVGKTWTTASLVTRTLQNRLRLLVPASELDIHRSLAALVASRLRASTSVQAADEVLLERLKAAAQAAGTGAPVVVLEDLAVPAADVDRVRHNLQRLAKQARDHGVKLLVTCQAQTWLIAKPGERISVDDVFSLEPKAGRSNLHSFELGILSLDEMEQAVRQRLGSDRAERVAHQLRAPAFAALHNPYLLHLYLDRHATRLSQPSEPPPLDVDVLLDESLGRSLERAADALTCDISELRPAFEDLCARLWDARGQGLSRNETLDVLESQARGLGQRILAELRAAGILTPESPLRFEKTPAQERIFALELAKRAARGQDIIAGLRPDEDSGAVAAFLRSLAREQVLAGPADAVSFAEALLRADDRWEEAVCDGLAQGSPDDVRAVALLCTLARPRRSDFVIGFGACRALGRLAARGGEARRWVASMYLSPDLYERQRGTVAASELMEFDARRVARWVSLRLQVAARMKYLGSTDRARRDKWVRGALDPLGYPHYESAAQQARQVVERFRSLLEDADEPRLKHDLAEVRGGTALWDAQELRVLRDDLASDDEGTRFLAAWSMRHAAFQQAELVAGALIERIRVEPSGGTLGRLLWASCPLTLPSHAEALLDAMRDGPVAQWNSRGFIGPALVMLSALAARNPARVLELLPRDLQAREPAEQAFFGEALAYAWWSLADQSDQLPAHNRSEPREQLRRMAELSTEEAPEEFRPFAARTAVTARLALMGEGTFRASAAQMHEWGRTVPHYYSDIEAVVQDHAPFLAAHPEEPLLREALLRCIQLQAVAPEPHPVQATGEGKAIHSAGFNMSRNCIEALAALLNEQADPLPALHQLPATVRADWQKLRAVARLLELGRQEAPLIAFARELCEAAKRSFTMQGADERDHCLALLARLESEPEGKPQAALASHRAQTDASLFSPDDRVRGFVELSDGHSENLLTLLDSSVRQETDVPTLYLWDSLTHDWRSLLMARVFKRMFDPRPISLREARCLCRWMLAALTALPDSPLREQFLTVYSVVEDALAGGAVRGGTINGDHAPLQDAHYYTVLMLNYAMSNPYDTAWLEKAMRAPGARIETNSYKIEDGSLSTGSGHHTIFVYPTIRLMGVALGAKLGISDPTGSLMEQRARVHQVLNGYFDVWRGITTSEDRMQAARSEVEALLSEAPHDERVHHYHVLALLLLGHHEQAREHADKYLSIFKHDAETRASLLYNLACARARLGDKEGCRQALQESDGLRTIDRDLLAQDPDLESMRDASWFQELRDKVQPVGKPLPQLPVVHTTHFDLSSPAYITDVRQDGERFEATISFGSAQFTVRQSNGQEEPEENQEPGERQC